MLATTNTTLEIPVTTGGFYHASALGEFDGATVTLETFVDAAWRPLPDGSWTEPFEAVVFNGSGDEARLVVTDAGAGTEISLNLTEGRE